MKIPLMPKPPDPTNFLACSEFYSCAKYRLRRTEDILLESFGVKTLSDLEVAMDRARSCKHTRFTALMQLYNLQHEQLAAADTAFEMARNLQRAYIANNEQLT